jgi:hypothetical protein
MVRVLVGLRTLILAMVMAIWTVLGPLFWIPLLARMVAYFTAMVTLSAVSRTDISAAQARLDYAVAFFPHGYRLILDSITQAAQPGSPLPNAEPQPGQVMALVKEILWAALFWAGIAYAAGFWSLGPFSEDVPWGVLGFVLAGLSVVIFVLVRKLRD